MTGIATQAMDTMLSLPPLEDFLNSGVNHSKIETSGVQQMDGETHRVKPRGTSVGSRVTSLAHTGTCDALVKDVPETLN